MATYDIQISNEKCTFCLRCQLGCSYAYTREFNQNSARIRIQLSGTDCSISFSEECRKCGVCVDNCFYGVLLKHKRREA